MTNKLSPGFLVAVPTLLDPNFRQSVVLLLEQNETGALGVVFFNTPEPCASCP